MIIKLIKSLVKSIYRAVYSDPEVEKIRKRCPRFFHFLRKRFTPDEVFGLYLTIGAVVTGLFLLLFFRILNNFLETGSLIQADFRLLNLVQILRTDFFNRVMLFITYLGNWEVVFTGMAFLMAVLFLKRRKRSMITLLVSVGGGELFVWLVKHLVQRPRPSLVNALIPETGFSFPSGHSFVAISFYGMLSYFAFRHVKIKSLKVLIIFSGVLLILSIGFSRIYLGAHYPSDVLASFVAAGAWVSVLITILEIRKKFNNPSSIHVFKAVKSSTLTAVIVMLFAAWCAFIGMYYKSHPLESLKLRPAIYRTMVLEEEIPNKLFLNLSRTSESLAGTPMEPINVIAIGTRDKLDQAFVQAKWVQADQFGLKSSWKLTKAFFGKKSYPEAPGIPSFWNRQPNDFAYEKSESVSVAERHHIHFWSTPFALDDGRAVWFGTVHYDRGVKLTSNIFLPTHTIDPAVDIERNNVTQELLNTGMVSRVDSFDIVKPTLGANQAGDQFFTDGKSYIIYLK